jgi:hypothetical protein
MYRRVQQVYTRAIWLGLSPVDAVSVKLGVSESVAKRRIARAKEAGYNCPDRELLQQLRSRDIPPQRDTLTGWDV